VPIYRIADGSISASQGFGSWSEGSEIGGLDESPFVSSHATGAAPRDESLRF